MTIHNDPELVMTLQSVIEFIGTFAFALSGIRLAASKHYDWLGGFVCGVAVAIGGGTIRDVMLGQTPFWMSSPDLIFSLRCWLSWWLFLCHHYLKRLDSTWFLFDTLGLALFNIAGIQKTLDCGFPFWVAIIMGCITGSFGGVIRDVLLNEEPVDFPQGDLCDGLHHRRSRLLGLQLSWREPLHNGGCFLLNRLRHPPACREIPHLAAYASG